MIAEQYNNRASAFNWLDAISGDNGNLDPRTYQIHQATTHNYNGDLIYTNPLYSPIIRQPPYARRNRVENWVRVNQFISDTTGFEPPENRVEYSCNSSTETLVEELQIPIRLEAEPPFPTPNAKSSLFGSHNQVCQRPNTGLSEQSEEGSNRYLAPTQSNSDPGSCERALWPFCQPLPAPSSSSSGTSEPQPSKPQWLLPLVGQVISNKACEACRKLRRKLSRGKNLEIHR